MLIQKKRIRNINNYITVFDGRDVIIAHALPSQQKGQSIGFTANQSLGEEVLPHIVGAITRSTQREISANKTFLKKQLIGRYHGHGKNGLVEARLKRSLRLEKWEYQRYQRIFTHHQVSS